MKILILIFLLFVSISPVSFCAAADDQSTLTEPAETFFPPPSRVINPQAIDLDDSSSTSGTDSPYRRHPKSLRRGAQNKKIVAMKKVLRKLFERLQEQTKTGAAEISNNRDVPPYPQDRSEAPQDRSEAPKDLA